MSLPKFPDLTPITAVEPKTIKSYTSDFPPYSDYVYSNIWSWNIDQSFKASDLNGNLVLFMRDPISKDYFFSLLGRNKINESFSQLLESAEHLDTSMEISLIPEETASLLDPNLFEIEESRDYHDYVYSTKMLSELKGKKYGSKRNLINQFNKKHSNWRVEHKTLSPNTKMKLLQFMCEENRRRTRLGENLFVEYEMAALERFILLPESDNFLVSILLVDDVVAGYSVDEILPQKYALSHFFKVSIDYRGSYDILNQSTATFLRSKGLDYWNWVEDLGIEGLRQAKMSYRPVHFLKLFSVTKK